MIIAKNDISIQKIKSIFENQNATVGDTIFDLMKCFKLVKLCRSLGVRKLMGYSVPSIVITLIVFPLMLKKRYKKDRSPKSQGSKRFKELTQDKISAGLAVIKRAAKHGLVPQYLLADSWYASEKFISTIRKIKQGAIHYLGRVRNDRRRYDYQGKTYNADELKRALKSKIKRCRKLKATYIEAVVEYKNVGKIKLFFSRFSRRGTWQILLTTDRSLSYIKAMEIYNIRWSIEVLYKECKQHLNLGKCQSNNFDAQIAELFDIEPAEHFKKLIYADELLAKWQTISGPFPSVEMEECLDKAA